MITVKTNISLINTTLLKKLEVLKNPKPLLRLVAFDVLTLVTERIHEQGKAADDTEIGQYKNNYLKLRQKDFKRSGDKKIIVSLTRQLENDWSVLGTEKGWGIGFKNATNAQKLKWVEEQKKKKIAALTKSEKEYAVEKIKKLIAKELS